MEERFEQSYLYELQDGYDFSQLQCTAFGHPLRPISNIIIGQQDGCSMVIGVDKKFNWFQKKMLKWCFGFEVEEIK